MTEREGSRSPDLDQTRQMLFPQLPPKEGWARMDAAMRGASDPERQAAIDRLGADRDLLAVLLEVIRKLRDRPPE